MPVKKIALSFAMWLVIFCAIVINTYAQQWNPGHKIGAATGKYHYTVAQVPDALSELQAAAIPNSGLSYQWQQSTSPAGPFTAIGGGSGSSYSFAAPLTQTMYYRRATTHYSLGTIYSNVVKYTLVANNWEDRNYIREHTVTTTGITTWQAVDNLPIGDKFETTTYMDGLGRPIQKNSRETATPISGSTWGDMVQLYKYDNAGRSPQQYLPFTSTSQPAKYKTNALAEQAAYYSTYYSETYAYINTQLENSPLGREKNIKKPGSSWAASAGINYTYEVNSLADDVKIWDVTYSTGSAPVLKGTYAANLLYKQMFTDENGKQVIEFVNKAGQVILKKVQLDDYPASVYNGWICTYYIYDDFGQLRFQLSPEAVKYLGLNSWSFAGANGTTILNEQCFQYYYDEKGRVIWKKAPGAQPLQMLYDVRDRLVLTQDGNQAALPTPQWTLYLYDVLDRPVATALYNTNKSVATLKADIAAAPTTLTITVTNPGTVAATFTAALPLLSSADLNNSSITTLLTYQFYDNYSFAGAKSFDANYTNTTAYNPGTDPDIQPIATSQRTLGMPTGSMERVLGSATFLLNTAYYDDRGFPIQQLNDNIKTGTDITTLQYHFDGRLLSSCNIHSATGTGYTNFTTLTKNLYDKIGRLSSVEKKYGSNAFKKIVNYSYDPEGRLKGRHLDPDYTNYWHVGTGLENLEYSYNIHSQLTGINKDYALKNPVNYNKWGHFFGMHLGYDNKDALFAQANLTGQVTGVIWNSRGDDAQRRYNYTYDNAGRLTGANYAEQRHPGDGYSNSRIDFTVTGNSGKITYDLNGNLLNLLQKGVVPGITSPVTIDNLNYTYTTYTNKLHSVTDVMSSTSVNGKFADFKDGSNGANPDYVYDANGNVVTDLNKNAKELGSIPGANGIKYNYLDKPEQIRIAGKGTINIVYSASGQKLRRTFTPEGAGTATTTTYINQFVYESAGGAAETLSYMQFEEGRVRVMKDTEETNGTDWLLLYGNIILPAAPGGAGGNGAFDYFITDYQQNIRMVLTQQYRKAINICTMESGRAAAEEPVFGQAGAGNEVAATRYAKPVGWVGNSSSSVSRLGNTAGRNIGPNSLQRVMAGDRVSATAAYYHQAAPGGANPNFVTNILASLVQAAGTGGATALVKDNAVIIGSQLNGTPGFVNAVQPAGSGSAPKAYLTVLFFDERFELVPAVDGGVQQQQVAGSVGAGGSTLGISNIKAPRNGYVYVYVSNESDNDVYFDNVNITLDAGHIIEESHYYAYGLKITGISSKKIPYANEGQLKNNYLYQGVFSEFDDELNWNDFALRNYDPQIGRWLQIDPYDEFASPYVGMGNDPVNMVDPNGGNVFSGIGLAGRLVGKAVIGAVAGGIYDAATGGNGSGVLWGMGIMLMSEFGTGASIRTASVAMTVVNGSITTKTAGGQASNGFSFANFQQNNRPTPLPQYVGTPYYYMYRYADFVTRNPNGPRPPDYYMNYGNKYMYRFVMQTRGTLSDEGKQWLDRTLKNLQQGIEDKLTSVYEYDYNIEQNSKNFTNFAFRTHANAYIDAGLFELSILDKVKIALTPDPKDLLSPEGMNQIKEVGRRQIEYYKTKPKSFMTQGLNLIDKLPRISYHVLKYAVTHGMNPKTVWNIVYQWVGKL